MVEPRDREVCTALYSYGFKISTKDGHEACHAHICARDSQSLFAVDSIAEELVGHENYGEHGNIATNHLCRTDAMNIIPRIILDGRRFHG